jgi:arylsulfatase A-like enzyme
MNELIAYLTDMPALPGEFVAAASVTIIGAILAMTWKLLNVQDERPRRDPLAHPDFVSLPFDPNHCPSGVCLPTRQAMLTGHHQDSPAFHQNALQMAAEEAAKYPALFGATQMTERDDTLLPELPSYEALTHYMGRDPLALPSYDAPALPSGRGTLALPAGDDNVIDGIFREVGNKQEEWR